MPHDRRRRGILATASLTVEFICYCGVVRWPLPRRTCLAYTAAVDTNRRWYNRFERRQRLVNKPVWSATRFLMPTPFTSDVILNNLGTQPMSTSELLKCSSLWYQILNSAFRTVLQASDVSSFITCSMCCTVKTNRNKGEYHLLGYKNPFRTSQETHYVSATESSRLMLCKIWGFTAVTMKNAVFWDIKTQFVLHRRHITSPLQSPAG
jgi:hypothetical protein